MSDEAAVQAIDRAFQKLSELAAQYGPSAVDTAAEVVRVSAVGDLMRAGGALALCLLFGGACAFFGWRAAKADTLDEEGWMNLAVGCFFVAVGFLLGSLFGLLDVWMWTALVNPKLALAHDLLSKIGVAQ